MSDILVFSPPTPENLSLSNWTHGIGTVCGWLRDEGYDFDQRSLFVDCRYLNQYRFRKDVVDLSVFEMERVAEHLRGNDDEAIDREARKLADILSLESYDTIIVPVPRIWVATTRDLHLLMTLPILKHTREDQTVIIGGGTIGSGSLTEDMDVERFSFVDYAVDGDMEVPLGNIFAHEFEGEDLVVEPGVRCVRDGEVLRGEPYQHPLEMKPKPYFDDKMLDRYADVSVQGIRIIPYRLGEGCAHNCSFCTYFEDQSYQYKSVDKVVRELKEIKKETGARHFWFKDQNLFNDPDHILELAERFQEEDMDIKWAGLSTIISRDQEFFDTLAESGCKAFQQGIESASDSVLHRMRKHQTRSMIESTLEKQDRAGIKCYALLITDYVEETWDEYFETVDFLRNNNHIYGGRIGSLLVLPDEKQPLYRDPERFGIELEEQEYDDWMERGVDFEVPYSDGRDETEEERRRRRKLKESYIEKIFDVKFGLRNFALSHPITFLRMQLRKLYTKDYPGISHYYV